MKLIERVLEAPKSTWTVATAGLENNKPVRCWKVKVKSLSRVWLFAIPWTAAYQAPPPMGFSRQEYWSGVPLPSPCDCLLSPNSFWKKQWMPPLCVHAQLLSLVWLFVSPWTVACQAPLCMELSRQEHWSGLPFPPPGGLPNLGMELMSLVSPALATVPPFELITQA